MTISAASHRGKCPHSDGAEPEEDECAVEHAGDAVRRVIDAERRGDRRRVEPVDLEGRETGAKEPTST